MSSVIGEYKIGKLIGEGAFSKVKLGVHTQTGQKVAIKIINKKLMLESNEKSIQDKLKRAKKMGIHRQDTTTEAPSATLNFINKLENEVQLLMRLDHPNVIRTYQVIDSEEECYVVMQYASGGEMMEYLAAKAKLSENEARKFFAQLISGLDHIHQANIVHRDLKLENLLLDEKNNVLITDFGLGRTYDSDRLQLLDTFCGTPHYAAVELVSGIPYVGVKSDIWALGVILYFFVTGVAPFSGATISELYDNIKKIRYEVLDNFSSELIDLLQKILRKDPHHRISLGEMKEHPWFHVNGRMDIPFIPPKISGKVDASTLGQVVKSINSDKEFQVYTFNYHEQQKSSISKAVKQEQSRQRSSSAVVARRKSISIVNGAQRPVFDAVASNQNPVVADPRSSVSFPNNGIAPSTTIITDSLEEETDFRTRSRRPTLTERPSFLATPQIPVITSSSPNSGLDEAGDTATSIQSTKTGWNAGKSRERSATVSAFHYPSTISPTAMTMIEPTLIEESQDQPTKLEFIDRKKSSRNDAHDGKSQGNSSLSPESFRGADLNQSPTSEKSFTNSAKAEISETGLMRRLSMVSKPMDQLSLNFAEDSIIANLELINLPMDEIAEWHAIHRPPKEIRTVKFNFRKGASSAVIDPASMFQDVHKVLLSLPESKNKSLEFRRHPDYYDFTCIYKEGDIELVKFDIEVCKVWLLDVHAIKIKRRQGDAYHFKRFYDKIVGELNWAK